MSFPGSLISYTNPSGTSLLTSPDHAIMHTSENTEIIAIEGFLGTSSGNAVFKGYQSGWSPLALNAGSVPQVVQLSGTYNKSILGSPTITGGTFNNQTLGSPTINGGTIENATITTGTIGSAVVLQPLTSAFFYQGSSTLTSGSPIPFSGSQLDTLSEYNGTYFIPKQAGIYLFFTGLYTSGNAGDFNIEIAYNGTVQALTRGNPNGYGIPVSWLGTVSAAGSVNVTTNGTGAIGTSSYFFGKRVF